MKKLLIAALVWTLLLPGLCPALAEPIATTGEGTMPLTVGVTTKMSGAFFTNKWGVNSADVDLRELIHGHNTISWERGGDYALDQTVIRDFTAIADGDDKKYRIQLSDQLQYNDGTPLTAWDYAFSALLLSSAEFAALGGSPTELSWLKGYEDFYGGAPFSGVHVVDNHQLELTIDGRYLPFFYEIVLLNITPYPIHVLAPGCAVKDDGQGAYIDGSFADAAAKLEEMRQAGSLQYVDEAFLTGLLEQIAADGGAYPHGLFCTALLQETILKEETGYLYRPTVSAGPYKLESFDREKQQAQFTQNPYYAGNFEQVVPQIDKITVVYADPATALDDIESGKLDLVNKISDGSVIATGMERMGAGTLRAVNYLRTGMNFISFACELGVTQSIPVRKAIAHCVDQNEILEQFAQGFGLPVYAYYGMGQWMAQANQEALQAFETPLDVSEAIRLLEADGWTLNEAGAPYNREVDEVRHRSLEDGTLEKLAVKWAQPKETPISALLEAGMRANLEAAGFQVEMAQLSFDELLPHYYRQVDREYHMFSLATNFNLAFDPYTTFHVGDEFQGESNKTGIRDEALMNLAQAMRQTEVLNKEGYVEKWLAFQARFSEVQPLVPLFSNVYFDFFRTDLQQYNSNAYFSWATAIVYAYLGEPPPPEEALAVDAMLPEEAEPVEILE